MKKILVFALTVAMVIAMTCSVAMAGSICPTAWDLEIELRKADASKVIKDGIIGEDEYERIEVDNSQLYITYNLGGEGDKFDEMRDLAYEIGDTIEYYFSWDEEHGLNIAVRYKPEEWNPFDAAEMIEEITFSRTGGIMLQVVSDIDCQTNLVYQTLAPTKDTENDVHAFNAGSYDGQRGISNTFFATAENAAIGYDASTGYVVYEISIPLADTTENTAVGGEIFFSLGVMGGSNLNIDQGYNANYIYGINLGQNGFFIDQTIMRGRKATVAVISDKEVGYTEPEPEPEPTPTPATPTPDNEPTPTPANNPTPTPGADNDNTTVNGGNNTGLIVAIIVEAVIIVALAACLLTKKKK